MLELRVLGYQFPESRADLEERDRNWLTVSADVVVPPESWSFTEPCLTTFELRELADWLRQVAAGEDVPGLSFTEPTLSFSIGAADPSGGTTIRIGFALEGRPPSRRRDEPLDVPWVVDFELTKRAVVEARRELQDTLRRFPSR